MSRAALPSSSTNRTVLAATLVAGAMIAQQVGGKAARDALFLSQFEIASLPTMMVVSALVSIGVVRWVMGRAAGWLVPRGFAASGLLLLGEWALAPSQPRLVAVALYLHIAVFGSVLISGFWSLVTDRFDPHTARRRMGQIATGAAVGAVVGGLLYQRADLDFRRGATHLARAALLKALELEPDLAQAHYTLGLIYSSTDQAKAKHHFQKFIEMAPDDPEAAWAKEMLNSL